jgi:hypothetical protein
MLAVLVGQVIDLAGGDLADRDSRADHVAGAFLGFRMLSGKLRKGGRDGRP